VKGASHVCLAAAVVLSCAFSAPQFRTDPNPPDWSEGQFRQLDRNDDNFISRGEWRQGADVFQRLDRNSDDRLSRNEFSAGGSADRGDGRGREGRGGRGGRDLTATTIVSSRQAWTDTGLDVQAGDELTIDAKGKIQFASGKADTAGPNGAPGKRRATASAPMPRLAIGALIARVGRSDPFDATAKGKRIREQDSGRLYLGINDDNLSDNSGEFRVTVSIKERKNGRGGRGQ